MSRADATLPVAHVRPGGIRPRGCTAGTILAIRTLVALLATASATRGDTIITAGQADIAGVTVLAIQDSRIRYRLPSGWEGEISLPDVELILIDGWEPFNRAERVAREGQFRQAAARYEALLNTDTGTPPAGARPNRAIDCDLLLTCRLVRAYDAIGRFDQAVEAYVQLCRRMPGSAEPLRPGKLPPPGSSLLAAADAAIARAVTESPGGAWAGPLLAWRKTWPAMEAAAAPGPEAGASRPPVDRSPAPVPRLEVVERVAGLIEARSFEEALAMLEGMAPNDVDTKAEICYWRGRCLEGMSTPAAGDSTAAQLTRAGLAYMRVVILYGDHPRAPECLRRAAGLCGQSGNADGQRRLLSELKERYHETPPHIATPSAGEGAATRANPGPDQNVRHDEAP